MNKLSADDLRLLSSFLRDPNDSTVELARTHLKAALTLTPDLQPVLESFHEPDLEGPIQHFLEDWRLEKLDLDFEALAGSGPNLDLERGAVMLAQLAYPKLSFESMSTILDRLAEDAERLLRVSSGSAHQQGALLARYLYQDLGFKGNESNYYDPDNSYINRVLERRTGIPISLSCVYLWVGGRLKLPVFGAGLPGHFIVGCKTAERPVFFDAFNGGRLLKPMDCAQIVQRSGVEFQDRFLTPMAPQQILARVVINLVNLYSERNQDVFTQRLSRWASFLQEPS